MFSCRTPNFSQLKIMCNCITEIQVGEPFKGGRSHVIVDGFCAPSEAERFCLGALANVNRNPGVINARRQIGPLLFICFLYSFAYLLSYHLLVGELGLRCFGFLTYWGYLHIHHLRLLRSRLHLLIVSYVAELRMKL